MDIQDRRLSTRLVLRARVVQVVQDDVGSVPLVALKDTVVRVSPVVERGVLGGDDISGRRFTGELRLVRGDRVVYSTGPTAPNGARVGPADELDDAAWDRELVVPGGRWGVPPLYLNCPLNFRVPAYWCRAGLTRLVVTLHEVGADPGTGHYTWRGDASFHDVRVPRALAVAVDWTDSTGTVRTPTARDMLSSIAGSVSRLPFPYFAPVVSSLRLASSGMFGVAATGGGCNAAFTALDGQVGLLQIVAALVGAGDVIAFVPAAALPASGPYNAGCQILGISSFVNEPDTLAHEVGHRYGCGHVAPAPGPTDPKYPVYPGLPTGSIGYVGIDTATSPPTPYSPSTTVDLMSYGSLRWTSPYTYTKIFDNRGRAQSEPADPRVVKRNVVVMRVRLLRDGTVQPTWVSALTTSLTALPEPAGPSPLSVDVLDVDGRITATHHLREPVARGCGGQGCGGQGCGGDGTAVPPERLPWRDLFGVVETGDGARALSFHTGGEPLLVLEAGEPPTVGLDGPVRRDGRVRLAIAAAHPRGAPTVLVSFSGNGGETWTPVALDPGDVVDLAEEDLPSRGTGRFRVVATAGLVATTVDSEEIDLPPASIRAHLVAREQGCAGETALSVLLDLRGHDMPSPAELVWRSDADGELGRGVTISAPLTPGRHEVSVTLPDGLGGLLTERAIIVIGG